MVALHTLGTIGDGIGCLKKAGSSNGEVITGSDKSYSIYKISFRCKCLIQQMYRIMLGEEDIPTSTRRNPLMKKDTYSAKVYSAAFDKVNKDKTR